MTFLSLAFVVAGGAVAYFLARATLAQIVRGGADAARLERAQADLAALRRQAEIMARRRSADDVANVLTLAAFSLTLAPLLASCRSTESGGCPPLAQYSAADQRQAAQELRALPKESRLAAMIADYGKTRDACRVSH